MAKAAWLFSLHATQYSHCAAALCRGRGEDLPLPFFSLLSLRFFVDFSITFTTLFVIHSCWV